MLFGFSFKGKWGKSLIHALFTRDIGWGRGFSAKTTALPPEKVP
jgi:hypothetical protein